MINQEKIRQAVELFLEGIGENPNREGLLETPDRIARMCEEIFGGLDENPDKHLQKTFAANGSDLIIERDIPFYSMCEHHFLPFFGKAYIGYIPKGRVAGLSKLARVVDTYARRPQIQEQLTDQIADALMTHLDCEGVIVILKAEHMCMSMRGVKKGGTQTVTISRKGVCAIDPEIEARFFNLIGGIS